MRRWRFVALGGMVVGVLAILAGALGGTEFRGGRPVPAPQVGGLLAPSPPMAETPGDLIMDLLRAFLFFGLCLSAIVFLFSRRFRRHVLYLLVNLAVFLLVLTMLPRWVGVSPPTAPVEAPPGAAFLEDGGSAEAAVRPAPVWAVYLAAVGAGGLLALWFGPRLIGVVEQRRKKRAIREVAREAAAELRQGSPVTDVVLRAWLRMVEILSARAGTSDRPGFTPREFAENLAKLGFRHEAIQVLTELFEEVRYGHKEGESRRAQALAALAVLEQAYA